MHTIDDVQHHLEHGCDGPLTAFVLIARATALAAKGVDAELVANGLFESLKAWGWLHNLDIHFRTGS